MLQFVCLVLKMHKGIKKTPVWWKWSWSFCKHFRFLTSHASSFSLLSSKSDVYMYLFYSIFVWEKKGEKCYYIIQRSCVRCVCAGFVSRKGKKAGSLPFIGEHERYVVRVHKLVCHVSTADPVLSPRGAEQTAGGSQCVCVLVRACAPLVVPRAIVM